MYIHPSHAYQWNAEGFLQPKAGPIAWYTT